MSDKLHRPIDGVSKSTQNALLRVSVILDGISVRRVTDFDEIEGWIKADTDQVENGEYVSETQYGHVQIKGLTDQQRLELINAGIKGLSAPTEAE